MTFCAVNRASFRKEFPTNELDSDILKYICANSCIFYKKSLHSIKQTTWS